MFATFDAGGSVNGIYTNFQIGVPSCEEVSDQDPRVLVFLARGSKAQIARDGYKDLIRRRARSLQKQGDELAALLLLKTIGE